MHDDPLLSPEEVMEYLHVNLRTVYRLIRAGLPAIRVGRLWRIRKSDVDAWLAAGGPRRRGDGTRGPLPPRHRILVVDDEQPVRDLLAKTLKQEQEFQVETAADGAEAIERLLGSRFDLLITDLKMPGMDGLSVIREARRNAMKLPVVIVTGYSTEASAIEAINMGGVTGYLTKPFKLDRIVAVAKQALRLPPAA